MLGAVPGRLEIGEDGVSPAVAPGGVRVMSSDLLLAEGAPLRWREPGQFRHVWRGTLESGMLREFLADVRWGALDVLLVDLPPGTDRLDALVELLPRPPGVVVVTIPSEASFRSVRRAVAAARDASLPVHGVIENMAGYRCAGCSVEGPLFHGDAGERLAREAGAPLLARIPFDPRVQAAVDAGGLDAAADGPLRGRERAPRPPGGPLKFLCVECDRQMGFAERELPGDGTLAAVFTCPACNRQVAMLTNPMETQLVASLGVKIGGRTLPEQPMELVRSAMQGGREDAFAEAPAPGRRQGPPLLGRGGQGAPGARAGLRPGHGAADLRGLRGRARHRRDHPGRDGPGAARAGPGGHVAWPSPRSGRSAA